MQIQRGSLFAALFLCALLIGCGKDGDKKVATQVAAKVNSDEITVHQVNGVLARNPNLPPEAAARAKRQIVDRLIDQELARQQAIEKKLDRSPDVVQALEAAKTEILARAYLRHVANAQGKPTPEEIKGYYEEHPELFAQRRVYMLEEINLTAKDDVAGELRAQVPKLRTMQAIAEWLKNREVQFTVNRGARAAEQLPLELLPKFSTMRDGDISVLESGQRIMVVRVVATKTAPIDEAKAAPAIHQYLFNRRSSDLIAEEMKRLKSEAKIEYVGEFAEGAVPIRDKGSAEPAKAEQPFNIEKGVRGLR